MNQNIIFTQILDSRGNPTLQAQYMSAHTTITTAVPSGASTGIHEAVELRDNEDAYQGKSVHKALKNAKALSLLVDWQTVDVREADEILLEEDQTENKSRFGANAILANSLLALHVHAHHTKQHVYEVIADLHGYKPSLPMPFANIINGGQHAQNGLQLQEFMIVPITATTFAQATQIVSEVYHTLKQLIADTYSPSQTALGDEGGFAPDVSDAHQACELLMKAAKSAGHKVAIAIDAAASEFYENNKYEVSKGKYMDSQELAKYYISLLQEFPIISLEDPFDQDDIVGHAHLKELIQQEKVDCQIVGDDLTVTNTDRIQQVQQAQAADALLLKINQIGTITQAVAAAQLAFKNKWNVMVSHRSGETTDTTIADIAVGLGCGQIKLGAPARGERTAKYNRLLTLEAQTSLRLRNDYKTKH